MSRCQLEFGVVAGPERQLTTEADDGNRTHNRPLTRRVLYRLSYVGGITPALSGGIIPKATSAYKVNGKTDRRPFLE